MKKIFFLAVVAVIFTACKKEDVEPETKVEYREPIDTSKAGAMYTEIINSYQNIFSPHLISSSNVSVALPFWDVMFNNKISDGEIVKIDNYPPYKVVFMFDTANYIVDSLNSSLIYLHNNSDTYTIQR